MDVQAIEEIVQKYRYGRFNLLDNDFKISYDPQTKRMHFDPLYHKEVRVTTGDCVELMNACYLNLREQFSDYYPIRAQGHDPNFFWQDTTQHFFLLLAKENFLENIEDGEVSPDLIERVNPLLIDPSFKRVTPFQGSGYRISRCFQNNIAMTHPISAILEEGQGFPLYYSQSQEMMCYLGFYPKLITSLGIAFQLKNQIIHPFDLFSDAVDEKVRIEPCLKDFVDLLRTKKINKTYEMFQEHGIVGV